MVRSRVPIWLLLSIIALPALALGALLHPSRTLVYVLDSVFFLVVPTAIVGAAAGRDAGDKARFVWLGVAAFSLWMLAADQGTWPYRSEKSGEGFLMVRLLEPVQARYMPPDPTLELMEREAKQVRQAGDARRLPAPRLNPTASEAIQARRKRNERRRRRNQNARAICHSLERLSGAVLGAGVGFLFGSLRDLRSRRSERT